MNRGYPTNLTDNQWQILQKILEPTTRKRKYSLRDIMDCILYINKTGCQWRLVPKDFPSYNIVFYYFTKWKREGVFEDIMDTLREKLRVALGREESPSVGIIDSRSVKTSQISVYVFPEDVKMKNGIFLQKRTVTVQFSAKNAL